MKPTLLSIILLSYYSNSRIRRSYLAVKELLDNEGINFEFIIIDDGSKDNSFSLALELEEEYDNVTAYQLSKNYGSMYSVFAGLSLCKGDCAFPLVDDEQQPYDTIVKMYRLWKEGNKIIIPCRKSRDDSILQSFLSQSYYKVMNALSDIEFPSGGADLAFIDREIIDILNNSIHHRNTMFIAEVLNLGYNPYFLQYVRPIGLNNGKSRYTFKKRFKLALDSLFSNSTFPLRLISYIGVAFSVISFLGIALSVYITLWGNHEFWGVKVPGWTSIILVLFLVGGLILLSLGVISEYLWRIDRPGYIVKKKWTYDEVS